MRSTTEQSQPHTNVNDLASDTEARCAAEIYVMEGEFGPCNGPAGHAGPHQCSEGWRWTGEETADIDDAQLCEFRVPEEWLPDSERPATMRVMRDLLEAVERNSGWIGVLDAGQRGMSHLQKDLARQLAEVRLNLQRLLTHLGVTPVSPEDVDQALADPDEPAEDDS